MSDKAMYILGGAVLVIGGGALALDAAKKKKAAAAAAAATGNTAEFPDAGGKITLPTGTGPGTPAAQAAALQVTPEAQAAAAIAAGVDQAILAAAAAQAGTTVQSVLAAAQNANPADPAGAAAAAAAGLAASLNPQLQAAVNPDNGGGQLAIVSTNDPAPSGDLIIRDAPDGNVIGAAEKGGTVVVLDAISPDSAWAHIAWAGGSRRDAATGFGHKSALQLL